MKNRNTVLVCIFLGLIFLLSTPGAAANQLCSLSVVSIPPGGVVLVDGSNIGDAPVTDFLLACGIHTIDVHKDGYAKYSATINIDQGTHRDIVANLQRIPDKGWVIIRSDPEGGDLYVDGKARGVTPCTIDNLLLGRHEIMIRKNGYEDYHDVVSAATDITTEYTEYLIPLPESGFLSITSTPEGADVRLDGRDSGKTPTNLQRVTSGNHTVEIVKTGYWNFTGIVNIKGGESILAKADLSIIPTSCTLYLDSSPQGAAVYLNDTAKGFAPLTLEDLPSGDYRLEFRRYDRASVNQSFSFMPGATYEIFAVLGNETGGSIVDREWQYQDTASTMTQPGWTSVNATLVIERTFTWYTNGHEAMVTLDIPRDLYDYYKTQPHPTVVSQNNINTFMLNDRDRQYLHNLVDKIKDSSNFKSYSARNDYRNAVAFVQSIAYKNNMEKRDYWKYPVETLADGSGDDEDTSILAAALLKEMGHDVAVVLLPDHAAVAVACENCNGYYYPLNGKRYYYLETTGAGFSPGTMAPGYQTSMATIIPL